MSEARYNELKLILENEKRTLEKDILTLCLANEVNPAKYIPGYQSEKQESGPRELRAEDIFRSQ